MLTAKKNESTTSMRVKSPIILRQSPSPIPQQFLFTMIIAKDKLNNV
jgi:hypothetical protein